MFDFSDFKQKLSHIIEHTTQEIGSLRTGKASVTMLDPVKVQVYGTSMAINELANLSTPDANMIIIDPWDKNIISDIEKAINKSDLNLNPVVDKQIIRITIAPLTEEKRQLLVKQLQQKIESAKAMMRSARTDTKGEIEDQEGESGVSEDDIHRDIQEMDKIMDEFEEKLEEIQKQKKQDLLEI
jgi:ribosome recycling factor